MLNQQVRCRCGVAAAALTLALSFNSPAAGPITSLQFKTDGTNAEGRQRFSLEWNTESNAVYLLHRRATLATNDPWQPYDWFFSTTRSHKVTLDGDSLKAPPSSQAAPGSAFYQVQSPSPQIFSLEPTLLDPNGGTVFLFGQCLTSNMTVRVGGLVLAPNVLQPGTTYSFDIAPGALPEGVYDVEILDGTNVVASAAKMFSMTAEPQPVGYARSLWEPPQIPPGAPMQVVELKPRVRLSSSPSARTASLKLKGNLPSLQDIAGRKWGHDTAKPIIANIKARIRPGGDCDDGGPDTGPGGGGGSSGDCDDARTFNNWPGEVDVIPPTGELQCRIVDMFVPGRGIDFVLQRTYRSRTGNLMALDDRWDHSYNIRCARNGVNIDLWDGTGRRDTYFRTGGGTVLPDGTGSYETFACDGTFNEGELSDPSDLQRFTLKFPNGGIWSFWPFDGSPVAGKIVSVIDRFGNRVRFLYDAASGRLTQVIDALGRPFHFSYDSSGKLTSVQDFTGRTVKYEYLGPGSTDGSPGDLASVTSPPTDDFPEGKTIRYTYSAGSKDERLNHNLLSITDPNKQTWLRVTYSPATDSTDLDYDSVTQVMRGIDKKDIRRGMVTARINGADVRVIRVTVRDSLGNVVEGDYDSRNRLIHLMEWTGRADPALPTTLTENRPVNPLRTNDPAVYETRIEWNRDFLPKQITFPQGDAFHFVHRQDFGQVLPTKRGELMVLRETPCCQAGDINRDGDPDLFERVWRFDYAPNFGSPALNMRERVNELESRLKNFGLLARTGGGTYTGGGVWTRPHSRYQLPSSSGAPGGSYLSDDYFGTAMTDPRGNVTRAEYDASGNRVKVKFPWLPNDVEEDWAYNSFGQLIAHTNAPDANGCRRVDTIEYYDDPTDSGAFGKVKKVTKDNGSLVCGETDHFRLAHSFEYDQYGYPRRIVDPRTNDWLFTFDALGRCARAESADLRNQIGSEKRIITTFLYDANDNPISIRQDNFDETGSVPPGQPSFWTTTFQYDPLNRIVGECRTRGFDQVCVAFAYDGNDNLTLYRSGEAVNGNDPHAEIAYKYDERDLPFQTVWSPSTTDQVTDQTDYTPNGRKSTQWEPHKSPGLDSPEIERTVFTYDGFDRPASIIDAMGNVQQFGFDANDNLRVWRLFGELNDVPGTNGNIKLAETEFDYDTLDRLTERRVSSYDPLTLDLNGDGKLRDRYTYAPRGVVVTAIDSYGARTRYDYDSANRLLRITDAKTNTIDYSYDNNGNVASITPRSRADLGGVAVGATLLCSYDSLNRLVSVSDNRGNNENWMFGSQNVARRHINPNGVTTKTDYDGLGQRLKMWVDKNGDGTMSASELQSVQSWDHNGRLFTETDGNSNSTHFAYNSLGQRIRKTSPDGTLHTFVWNARGSVISSTDPNGTTVSNRYDLLERCVRRDITPGSGVALTTSFEAFAYNGMSLCTLASNDLSLAEFHYDSLGNELRAKLYGRDVLLIYDQNGRCTSMTYPSGLTLNYTYDALSQVKTTVRSSAVGSATLASFDYEGDRLARISRANGINTRIQWNGFDNSPVVPGDFGWQQIALINHQNTNGGAVIDRRMFAYDNNQNKILRQQLVSFSTPPTLTTNIFGYDALDRMTTFERRRASMIATKSFELDNNGNRIVTTSNGVVFPYTMDNTTPQPADFQMDQYTMTPFGRQQYDDNGNLIVAGSSDPTTPPTFYRYDYADRLVEVSTIGNDGTPRVLASFIYDALGRRISKTVSAGPAPIAPITTQYLYAGDEIIEERDGNGAVVVDYVRFPSSNTPIVRGSALGGLMCAIRDGHTQYYHLDDLGSPLAITDENGAVLERYDYDEYGMPRFYSADGVPLGADGTPASSSAIGNRFLFRGMEWDSETGFYFARGHRPSSADPYPDVQNCVGVGLGRTISRGTAGLGGNAYTFAGENPWTAAPEHKRPGPVRFSHIVLKRGVTKGHVDSAKIIMDRDSGRSKGFGFADDPSSSARLPRPVLKTYFETGDKPTAQQFGTLIDSCLSYDDDRAVCPSRFSQSYQFAWSVSPSRCFGAAQPHPQSCDAAHFSPPPPTSFRGAREAAERTRLYSQAIMRANRKIE